MQPNRSIADIRRLFLSWDVVAVPDRDEPEWWAGAPSVCRGDDGSFWMAARMRTADAPLGLRGYEIRLYHSPDGARFRPVHSLRREDVPIAGFERPALFRDHRTGQFRLLACGPIDGTWNILEWPAAGRPDSIRAADARVAISPPAAQGPAGPDLPAGYKDPVVCRAADELHCYVIGILGRERLFHFVESDGAWLPVGSRSESLLPLAGWHTHSVRPAGVVPMGPGWLFVYEGSSSSWVDPSYNIATGLAWTFDLHHLTDLTVYEPLLVSPTPGRLSVWRYSHWLWVGPEIWVYAEVEAANGAHEIRRFRLPASA